MNRFIYSREVQVYEALTLNNMQQNNAVKYKFIHLERCSILKTIK